MLLLSREANKDNRLGDSSTTSMLRKDFLSAADGVLVTDMGRAIYLRRCTLDGLIYVQEVEVEVGVDAEQYLSNSQVPKDQVMAFQFMISSLEPIMETGQPYRFKPRSNAGQAFAEARNAQAD